jgi:hypothetical protein
VPAVQTEYLLERENSRTGESEVIQGVLAGEYTPPSDRRSYARGEVKGFTFQVKATGQYLRLSEAELKEASDYLREAGYEDHLNNEAYTSYSDNYGDYPGDDDRTYFQRFGVEPENDPYLTAEEFSGDYGYDDPYWYGGGASTRSREEPYLRVDLLACDPLPPPTAWKRLLKDEEF